MTTGEHWIMEYTQVGLNTKKDEIRFQRNDMTQAMFHLGQTFKTKEVYVAGGMLRDHYFNNPGNDIDIYMSVPDNFDVNFLLPAIVGIDIFSDAKEMKRDSVDAYGHTYTDEVIETVIECKLDSNVNYYADNNEHCTYTRRQDVQIIFLKQGTITPLYYIAHGFCCSLSKVYMTHDDITFYTEDFMNTIMNKEINFDWTFHNNETNHSYVNKILSRFPDYEVDEESLGNYRRELALEQYR